MLHIHFSEERSFGTPKHLKLATNWPGSRDKPLRARVIPGIPGRLGHRR